MVDIREQKLLYHLTALENLPSILSNGLLPRSRLDKFVDIANSEIIDGRKKLQLDKFVPFHFFALNPFAGSVQKTHLDKDFVLVTVTRKKAEIHNWKIIPQHPLACNNVEMLNYEEGMRSINWKKMNERNYNTDAESHSVCMAECLSDKGIKPSSLCSFFVKTKDHQQHVQALLRLANLQKHVNVNPGMFVSILNG